MHMHACMHTRNVSKYMHTPTYPYTHACAHKDIHIRTQTCTHVSHVHTQHTHTQTHTQTHNTHTQTHTQHTHTHKHTTHTNTHTTHTQHTHTTRTQHTLTQTASLSSSRMMANSCLEFINDLFHTNSSKAFFHRDNNECGLL